ncbi:hypothetical protein GCM10010232_68210 [Streptomyces amakusaensis]|uniref:Helix-turn-helix domain-containing protein n=1 Tax=Streptomyces amakusaensis TaxID=67271 RepID=A0ABW0ATD1_9ACTN
MTTQGQDDVQCPAAGCTNPLEQKPTGRRRLYCSDNCGTRYRKYQQDLPKTINDAYALQTAKELEERVRVLVSLVESGQPVDALREIRQATNAFLTLRGAMVQQAHDRKIKSSELGTVLHVSPDTLRRWKEVYARRRGKRTSLPAGISKPRAEARVPSPRHPEPAPNLSDPAGPPTEGPPTTGTAATVLARALSRLHRESGLSFSALGRAVGVHRSYISRLVSGQRLPSWKTARRFAAACDADPEDLRPLWNAARGYRVPQPGTLHAALRGMNLAAGHLTPDTLTTRTGHTLTTHDVTGLLSGTRVTDWTKVETLVTALGGQPDLIRPLWETASAHPGPTVQYFNPTPAETASALKKFGIGVQP